MSISKLYTCMDRKKANQSQAREAIYRILMGSEHDCLSVSQILNTLSDTYPKKISLNTVYRHLNLFVSCKLAVMIQDDYKKAYFCLTQEEPSAFIICTKCNQVGKLTALSCSLMQEVKDSEFITIHKRCHKCKEKMK